ncbi:MAG: PEP-CTERM sorting domain-containing protein [Planctomycetota bacterium]
MTAAPAAHATFTTFSAAGDDPASIQGTVDAFRDALGDLNPFVPTQFADGRRQIDWDAAPAAVSSPNPFPGDFFNFSSAPRARGIEFSTPGTGFALSGDADDGTPLRFADLNPTYEDEFQAFSEERLFTPRGSNVTRVDFFSPEDQTTPALSDGLGIVFADVDLADTTTIEYYGLGSTLLLTQTVEVADKGLSFAGATFDTPELAYAIITTGNFDIGPTDGAFGYDVVVLDDFIFGEPIAVPEPATAALLGLGALAMLRRRTR